MGEAGDGVGPGEGERNGGGEASGEGLAGGLGEPPAVQAEATRASATIAIILLRVIVGFSLACAIGGSQAASKGLSKAR